MTASQDLDVHEVADLYAVTRDSLVVQLRALSKSQAETIVPSCPEWTVKDVVAHVAGLVSDVMAAVPPPLGSDENTTRQVFERRNMSLGEICDEWQTNATAFAPLLVEDERRAFGITADLAVHVHDLAETIDSIAVPSQRATRAACQLYVRLLQERVAERLGIALTVNLDGREREPGAGDNPLMMTGTSTDFLRSITGRRTRAQAEAFFEWRGDPITMLDQAFTQYGPFRITQSPA
jgi:uncharacterized protein (TIGR03083 family)